LSFQHRCPRRARQCPTCRTLTRPLVLTLLAVLAACTPPVPPDAHVPPFAKLPYEPISRATVVAVALREWRLFGAPVDDDPPGTRPPQAPDQKPEREDGLWQRVGEYWWLGQDAGNPDAPWTGKHDARGQVFAANIDAEYAWSAAFVSYVMRIAGAGARFPYSPNHGGYINIAKQMALGKTSGWIITAERPENYAPLPGDLICLGRGRARSLRYDDLPAGLFPGHCDIVVDTRTQGTISVVGGNVDDAVTLKHVPVTPDGRIASPDGTVLDQRYAWMVVVRLLLSAPAVLTSQLSDRD
jgi:hypothetical protein